MPSRPSSRTPSGSPIAPIAVVSSPGITRPWTTTVSRRARTAAISASPAPGVITIIIAAGALQAELAHAELVGAQMMGELVTDGARDLLAQLIRVVPEVAAQRVAEDHDAVRVIVARDPIALVEPIGVLAPALVGDHDGDVVERPDQQIGQVVEGLADELLEVVG